MPRKKKVEAPVEEVVKEETPVVEEVIEETPAIEVVEAEKGHWVETVDFFGRHMIFVKD